MTKLPNQEFRQLVCLIREKDFYEHEDIRPIHWPEYNLSQIKEAEETLRFIRESVDEADTFTLKGKAGKPLTNPKSLAKAVLTCEALGLTERNAQGWLSILGPFLGIDEQLDDRTIGDAYNKVEVIFILKQIFEKTKGETVAHMVKIRVVITVPSSNLLKAKLSFLQMVMFMFLITH